MPRKLILFDCDGVLVDSETLSSQIFAEEATKLGWKLTTEEVLHRFAGGKFAAVLAEFEANIQQAIPPDFERHLRQRTYAAFRESLQPIPSIKAVIEQLQHPFCVASNGPRAKIELNLGITGLLPYFEGRIFSAYELNIWKPDPAFYLTVAQQLGYAPEDCLVIEDSLAGLRSAKAAGIEVWVYAKATPDERILAEEVRVFRDMGELPRMLLG
ncbi:MAG: HAD-IA family hydrolase [Saprospiraceae bacterium]